MYMIFKHFTSSLISLASLQVKVLMHFDVKRAPIAYKYT
jgi:hypothetical protein